MAWAENCAVCDRLRDEASVAVNRHVKAVGRLELARLSRDFELLRALEIVVNEAAEARQTAVAALKQHLDGHRTVSDETARKPKETGAASAE